MDAVSAEGSPRRLYRLGRVRTEPEAARGQRLWQGGRCEVGPRRTRVAGRAAILGPLRAALDGKLLRPPPGQPVYRSERPNQMLALPRCFTFGGLRVDAAVGRELLRAVEPMAIEAAVEAERRYMEAQGKKQRIVELELQQARYEASLAERRYAACDPDNRLIAVQLENSWEAALCRVETCQATAILSWRHGPDPLFNFATLREKPRSGSWVRRGKN